MVLKINFILKILKGIGIIMDQNIFRGKCQNLNTSVN